MLWDGLIVLTAVVLAVNGWRRGLIRSWRGPIAIVLATILTQHFYIDFATWIMSRLRISPESAVVMGYLMLWFSSESLIEITLSMVIKGGVQHRPIFFDRAGGALYGLAKTAVIILLPLMATSVDLKIPPPPPDKSGLVLPDAVTTGTGSYLVPGFAKVADAMVPIVGNYVVSLNAPSFTPSYQTPQSEENGAEGGKPKVDKKDLENLLK